MRPVQSSEHSQCLPELGRSALGATQGAREWGPCLEVHGFAHSNWRPDLSAVLELDHRLTRPAIMRQGTGEWP